MGGSWYIHIGGGSNFLCLPENPIYDKVQPGVQKYSASVYGTEYETSNRKFYPSNDNHDAACAVCHTEARVSHVMIPARNICPKGWTMEYNGYLMAAYDNYQRTEFICVDGKGVVAPGTYEGKDGAVLYFVEGHCGSLPCRPYVEGYELTCVVCTK